MDKSAQNYLVLLLEYTFSVVYRCIYKAITSVIVKKQIRYIFAPWFLSGTKEEISKSWEMKIENRSIWMIEYGMVSMVLWIIRDARTLQDSCTNMKKKGNKIRRTGVLVLFRGFTYFSFFHGWSFSRVVPFEESTIVGHNLNLLRFDPVLSTLC